MDYTKSRIAELIQNKVCQLANTLDLDPDINGNFKLKQLDVYRVDELNTQIRCKVGDSIPRYFLIKVSEQL